MTKKAKKIYEKYKKSKISFEELNKAQGFVKHLGNIGDKFALLIRMIKADKEGSFKIPTIDKLKIIGAIIYVISPIDAVFDYIPFIGFGDDIGVVVYVLTKLNSLITEFEEFEIIENKRKKDENVDFDNLRVVNED